MKVSRSHGRANGPSDESDPQAVRRRHGLAPGMAGLVQLMERLLGPGGCPWDREQTLQTLKPYLLEEAYEVLESMDDPAAHRQELGDLLFQVVFHAALRNREGAFDFDGVVDAILTKMVRRHPHVFARDPDAPEATAADVEAQWARIKQSERDPTGVPDPLAGVPRGLPALARAWRLQEKAAAVGFDWPTVEDTLAKVAEEWEEFEHARRGGDPERIKDELGDLLFVLVRVGQKLGIEAEDAVRHANRKFERRFAHVMLRCHEQGVDPAQAGLATLETFWDEAKRRRPDGDEQS